MYGCKIRPKDRFALVGKMDVARKVNRARRAANVEEGATVIVVEELEHHVELAAVWESRLLPPGVRILPGDYLGRPPRSAFEERREQRPMIQARAQDAAVALRKAPLFSAKPQLFNLFVGVQDHGASVFQDLVHFTTVGLSAIIWAD